MSNMIEIKYLKDCDGASRFGSCANCCVGSDECQNMAWIIFNPTKSSYYTTICLCDTCRLKLVDKILNYAMKEVDESDVND